jgi:type I restriction enzyme M protein
LPYNDPRTLSLFLKEINEFSYEHSENLGNAFEYLLSILGSQGDAGQFRTPRHIIDFIVEVVDPKKNETILDPACGTAGFLISAYKHILKTNKEKPLTPDEKLKLMNNLAGYDISPDMVKLALVNMYLHGFPEPKIHEYDTLSSEKRWDETFDVILANPPFMTPKGGITPHKRFSIQASRAEVLFVDYIVEHLTIKGRAGIIVPEGIIFQSNKAYTQLRKKLVEDGLFAVVSLPSGVFQPYSVVKTSILLFDKETARTTKNVLFVKIQHDGFDLGAQRREIDKNDLPLALQIIRKFKSTLSDSEFSDDEKQLAHVVAKEKIIESGDYNLSGERYGIKEDFGNVKYPLVEVGEICELGRGRVISKIDMEKKPGIYPVYSSQTTNEGIFGYLGTYDFDGEYVTWTTDGANAGTVFYRTGKFNCTNVCGTLKSKSEKVDMRYLARVLNNVAYNYVIQVGNPKLMNNVMAKIKIPLPPLEVQKEIVEQIEVKQKAIDHAKAVIESLEKERRYFGQALKNLEGVEWVELGEVAEVISGQSPESKYYNTSGEGLPFYQGKTEFTDIYVGEPSTWTTKITKIAEKGDILMSVRAPVGPVNIATQKICIGRGLSAIRANNIEPMFLFNFLKSIEDEIKGSGGAVFDSISRRQIEQIKIPLPPLEIQKQLVAEAEKEEEIITANRRLIEIMERKIEEVLSNI